MLESKFSEQVRSTMEEVWLTALFKLEHINFNILPVSQLYFTIFYGLFGCLTCLGGKLDCLGRKIDYMGGKLPPTPQ